MAGMTDADAKKQTQDPDPHRLLASVRLEAAQAEELPKTEEEQKAKIKEVVDKMTEAEKNNPAVTMPKGEEIQAASLKKSEEIETKLQSLTPGAPERRRRWHPGIRPVARGRGPSWRPAARPLRKNKTEAMTSGAVT